MQIVSLILGIWIASIIFMSFYRLRIGICLYVAYIILVPYMNIHLGITLQWNLVNTLILLAYLFSANKTKCRISFKPYLPFLFLYISQLMEMPFQDRVSFDHAFNSFRLDLMGYLILPFVMWNASLADPKLCPLLRKTVVLCICIAFGYGLFLTTTGGLNPYQMTMMAANGEEWNESYAAIGGGRLFGRISSVFGHPMTYGLFLGLALVYIYAIRSRLNRLFFLVATFGIIAAIFLCGIRSPIGALFGTILVFLFLSHKTKLMFQFGIVGCVGYAIISAVPELNSFVESIFSDKNSTVAGSSFEMRLVQLMGCFAEIRDNPLFGNGYGWTGYYLDRFGDHPVILAFESLIYVVLCNSGFFGVIIWGVFLIMFLRNTVRTCRDKETTKYAIVLMTYFLAYATITGLYGFMKYFILFYTLILMENKSTEKVIKK